MTGREAWTSEDATSGASRLSATYVPGDRLLVITDAGEAWGELARIGARYLSIRMDSGELAMLRPDADAVRQIWREDATAPLQPGSLRHYRRQVR